MTRKVQRLTAKDNEAVEAHRGAKLELEHKFTAKLEEQRQVTFRISQTATERERELREQVFAAQRTALRMYETATDRAQKVLDALHISQNEIINQQKIHGECEREFVARLADVQRQAREQAEFSARNLQKLADEVRAYHESVTRNSVRAETTLVDFHAQLQRRLDELRGALVTATQEREESTLSQLRPWSVERSRVGDFDAYKDKWFVDAAYQTLLGRPPDPEGFEYYRSRLRGGVSKTRILGEIRYSVEGKIARNHVDGLAIRYFFERACDVPVAGILLRIAGALWHLPDILRQRQSLEAELALLREIKERQTQHTIDVLKGIICATVDDRDRIHAFSATIHQHARDAAEAYDKLITRHGCDAHKQHD